MLPIEIVSVATERLLEGSEFLIRAPKAEDIDALARIDGQWTGRQRRAYLAERLGRTLRPAAINLSRVAELDGRVVGFLFGEVTRGEFGDVGSVAWVDTVAVERARTREGVGSALLADFVAHATTAGSNRIWTLLDPGDEALTEFLQAHGFRVAATRVVEKILNTAGVG
jgi:predicted N-acetyltransferase YhbS